MNMGVHYRTCCQLIFTAHTLYNEFEHREFRFLQNEVVGSPFGAFIEAPVLTKWEHVSKAFRKFLQRCVGFGRLCKAIYDQCKADHSKKKISSYHLSLASEEILVTMPYFSQHAMTYTGTKIVTF